jgi:hypothetical protein
MFPRSELFKKVFNYGRECYKNNFKQKYLFRNEGSDKYVIESHNPLLWSGAYGTYL